MAVLLQEKPSRGMIVALLGLAIAVACGRASLSRREVQSDGMPVGLDVSSSRTDPDALRASSPSVRDPLFGGWHRVPLDPSVGPTLERAHSLALAGAAEDAIAVLNRGLEASPRNPALFEARGALYAQLGFGRAAERDFDSATRLRPDSAGAWFGLGRVRQELGLSRAALEAVRIATRLGMDEPELDLVGARAMRRLGQRGPAAARYARALGRIEAPSLELLREAATLADDPRELPIDVLAQAVRQVLVDEAESRRESAQVILERCVEQSAAVPLESWELSREELFLWTRVVLLAVRMDDPPAPESGEAMALAPAD